MKITFEAPRAADEGPVTAIRDDLETIIEIYEDNSCPLSKVELTHEEAKVLAMEMAKAYPILTEGNFMDMLMQIDGKSAEYEGVPVVVAAEDGEEE